MSYLVHSGQQSIVNGIIMETEAKLTEAGHPPDEIKALMKQLKEARAALNFTIEGKVNINVIDINETKKEYLGTLEKLKKGLPGYGLKILEAGPGKLEIEITVLKDYSGDAFEVTRVIPSADEAYNKFISRLAYDVSYISDDGSDTIEYGMAKVTIKKNLRAFGEDLLKRSVSSPGGPDNAGGIDFRAMNYLVQPMGSFKDLSFGLPTLTSSALERIDLDKDLAALRNMVKAGMVPSGERVKEYLAACFQKGKIEEKQDDLLVCLAEIYRLAEDENLETSPQLRESLVIVDTARFVLPNNQKITFN